MDITHLLSQLEGLAHKLGLEIRYEAFGAEAEDCPGGYCRLRDKKYVIVNKELSPEAQAMVLGLALKDFDLEGIYVRPAVRDFLGSPLKFRLSKTLVKTVGHCSSEPTTSKETTSYLTNRRLLWSSKQRHR